MSIGKLLKPIALGAVLLGSMLVSAGAETLKIGVIAPLTGGGAPWGIALAQAVEIRAADANAAGGLDVGGRKYQVEVIALDDQYNAAKAVAAYHRLVGRDGVKYLVLLASSSTMAVKQMIENDKVIALTTAYTSKAIDAETKYMFRGVSTPTEYLPPLIGWLKSNIKERRLVLINPNDETGWGQANIGEKTFKQAGFDILGSELYERGQKDFLPMMTKVIAWKPDLIDLGTTPPSTAGLIIRQARQLGYKGRFVKTGGPGPKEIIAAAGSKKAVEGMISIAFGDPQNPTLQRLEADYRKAIGQEPNGIIGTFYDSANVLFAAIHASGDVNDPTKVAKSFARVLPMKSIYGDELTLGHQQILTTTYIAEMRDGQPVIVGKAK